MRVSSRYLVIILLFLLLFFIFLLPNFGNEREKRAFSEEVRLKRAESDYHIQELADSVTLVPGPFYERNLTHEWLLGANYRDLWQLPVRVPVLNFHQYQGGLHPLEFSGNQQTIGIEAKDTEGKVWSLRSVNKDQSKALPRFLQYSLLRPMFRDQASALNPYGALVVPVLAGAVNIQHTQPILFFFPYDPSVEKEYNQRMAGRLVLVEEEADESWADTPAFQGALDIMDTEEMLEASRSKNIPIDTLLYARSRLFDMLISDWDRHEGNWKWALLEEGGQKIIQPVPVDRDMAFYNFGKGAINQMVLLFNEKFQSFSPEFESIPGLMHQSRELDLSILSNISREELLQQAHYIQARLEQQLVRQAFLEYPPLVYQAIGKQHEEILHQRIKKLPEVAERFYELIQEQES